MMMNTPEEGGAYQMRFRQRFPVPNSSGDSLLSLYYFIFDLRAAVLPECLGKYFYSWF
jgi:hypothetical protein